MTLSHQGLAFSPKPTMLGVAEGHRSPGRLKAQPVDILATCLQRSQNERTHISKAPIMFRSFLPVYKNIQLNLS